jgi:very-short-patch-repair endonuclease
MVTEQQSLASAHIIRTNAQSKTRPLWTANTITRLEGQNTFRPLQDIKDVSADFVPLTSF